MVTPLVADNPWLGMGIEVLLLSALMGTLRACQRRFALSPEASRKLFHVGGGLTTLGFPWLFHSVWPVLALAPLTIGMLLALKYVRRLRGGLGNVLYGIHRHSLGEVYMPLSITLVWVLSGGNALLYSIPVLILTLADPTAALIGMRYGRVRYTAVDGEKSVEGSLAFFVVALLSVQAPLLLFSDVARPATLLIALNVALLAMMAESVAWRGLDNFFIPLVSFSLLKTLLPMRPTVLAAQLVVTSALAVFALFWHRRMVRNRGALMGATLGAYLVWVLAGW
jgi:phytol kinase